MRWVRDADRHIKEFDCANELGAREIREHRNLGVHLHRELSGGRRTCESAWFDTVWMRKGIKPTMVESDSCLERRVRRVLILFTKFECWWVRVSHSDVEWDQFHDKERTEAMKVGKFKMECGDGRIPLTLLFMTA